MPREWNPAQREALESLAEMLRDNETPLSRPDPRRPLRPVLDSFSDMISTGASVEVPRVVHYGESPIGSQRARGSRLPGDVWHDTHDHNLWIMDHDPLVWVILGPDEDYMWSTPESHVPWMHFGHSMPPRGPYLIRNVSVENRRGRRGHTADSVVVDDMLDAAEYTVGSVNTPSRAIYIAVLEGYGPTAIREILCGPFTIEGARAERQALRGLDWRIVTKRLVGDAARSMCNECFRPSGFAHQKHCSCIRLGEFDDEQ